MQFHIPQFIDIEDKIFGPFTFKQFVYVVGAAGATFLWYSIFPIYFAILLILPTIALAFMLGFKPIHGRPFAVVLEGALKYFFGGKLYLWKKEDTQKISKKVVETPELAHKTEIPKINGGKLENMSWSLDTQQKKK